MPTNQPFIISAPDLGPPGREWWFIDPTVGPVMTNAVVATVFYGWTGRNLNLKLNMIKEDYEIPFTENNGYIPGRKFTLFDVERITRLFLNRSIIDYRRFYAATQIMVWMGRNHDLI